MIKSNSGFNQFGFGKSTIWLIRGGLALYLPSASVQTALSSSPYYRPEGLQGTNRFGGSDAAPNPCFNLLMMPRWGEWPSTRIEIWFCCLDNRLCSSGGWCGAHIFYNILTFAF